MFGFAGVAAAWVAAGADVGGSRGVAVLAGAVTTGATAVTTASVGITGAACAPASVGCAAVRAHAVSAIAVAHASIASLQGVCDRAMGKFEAGLRLDSRIRGNDDLSIRFARSDPPSFVLLNVKFIPAVYVMGYE